MSANWYNLAARCDSCASGKNSPNHDDPARTVCEERTTKAAQVCVPLPTRPTCHREGCFYGRTTWGWYPWQRRKEASLTPVDYAADLRSFVRAVHMQRNASVVWIDPLPQHCGKGCGFASSAIASDQISSGIAAKQCMPWPWFGNLTEQDVSPRSRSLVCPQLDKDSISLEGCEANLSRWRYQVAEEVLRDSGLPVVPFESALSSRVDLHTDCTHYCHPSEGALHMAMAVLNTMAAVLRRGGAHAQ